MRVAVITDTVNNEHYTKYLESFAKGCSGEMVTSDEAHHYDCAVIFGSYKKERGKPAHKGKGKIVNSGMPYVQIETQLIGRPITTALHKEFRVGVNGFLWDDALWGFEHIKSQRAEKVFSRNGYDVKKAWKTTGDDVLVCMQKVGDASLRGLNIFDWTLETVKRVREHSDRSIVVRPHPLYRKKVIHQNLRDTLEQIKNVHWQESDLKKENFIPIEKQLQNVWCTVTYTSGTGVDAVLNGTPNIACDSGSMVYDVSSNKVDEIENPFRGPKDDWSNKIAHCQWSLDEFESGECWEHVSKSI